MRHHYSYVQYFDGPTLRDSNFDGNWSRGNAGVTFKPTDKEMFCDGIVLSLEGVKRLRKMLDEIVEDMSRDGLSPMEAD